VVSSVRPESEPQTQAAAYSRFHYLTVTKV